MSSQPMDRSWTAAANGAESVQRDEVVQLGVWMFLATVLMMFAAFSSAYIVRRSGSDWTPIGLPRMLWLNTAILVASSLVLEGGRRARTRDKAASAGWGLLLAIGLGFLFLVGQLAVWRELVAQGVYLPTSPHSAFVYILTGIHGLHVVAGLLLLIYTLTRIWAPPDLFARRRRISERGTGADRRAVARLMTASATFWHFLAVLWLYVFVLVAAF